MADYSIINTTPSTLLIRDIYDNAIQGFTNDLSAVLQYSDVKMEFFLGTTYQNYLTYSTSTLSTGYTGGWWNVNGNFANFFLWNNYYPVIGSKVSDMSYNEGICQPGWLAFQPAQNSTNDINVRLAIRITPLNNKKITGYRLYYQDQRPISKVGIQTGQNATQHQYSTVDPRSNSNQGSFTYYGSYGGYDRVYEYVNTLTTHVTSTDFLYVHLDAGGDGPSDDNGTIRLELDVVDPYAPTTLLFVNNTLTVTNDISGTDLDLVSFQLPAGSIMYSFNVTNLLNANSITYSLKISGGANVSAGTITSTGVNLLGGNNLTPAVDTTYILTLTSGSTNTYTIIGKMLGPGYTLSGVFAGGGTIPWNSISNSNAFGKSYVNNFVDLSGDIIIRKDGALTVGGDVSMGGNLIMTTPGPTLTPYFISNAFLQSAGAPFYNFSGNIYYYVGITPVPLTTISVDSLDKISISNSKMTGGAITSGIVNATYACRYTTDHTGATVYNNWIVGVFGETLTKLCRVAFTLNGTTPSIAYIRQAYAVGNYTINDVSMALPFNVASINGRSTVNHVSSTEQSYLLTDISLNVTTTAPVPKLIINDLSLNARLFIGGNVSIQGNVNIGGDVSINKQFSGNFADGIIPTSAIINYPSSSSGGDVTITGKVQTLGDVSFNGTTLQVGSSSTMKINGNLILSDQTVINSYDNNISSGTFAQGNVIFKDSRFDSVVVLGAATVTGTITATSDYRIKENVEDLDSSFTLDSLTPVEYDNVLSGNHEYGVIAHEMQATYPFLVQGEKDGPEYQRVSYPGLIGVMVNEVKTLKQNLDALKTRI
jgi:hypothetical protein